MKRSLKEVCGAITAPDISLEQEARTHLDDLTKPRGSFGRLEDVCTALYCMNGGHRLSVDPVRMLTIAGDHGIVCEGVSAYPKEVTRQMVANILDGGAAISVLCKALDISLKLVDAGCEGEPFPAHPLFIDKRIRSGTSNMALGPAMSKEEAERAVLEGVQLAEDAVKEGFSTLAIGELGIGNSTAATALFCAWLNADPYMIAGPGTGLDSKGITHKAEMIQKALDVNAEAIHSGDALAVLAAVGGLEIAMMAGIVLGSALHKIPCIIDGFISQAAWLSAIKLCPSARGYTIISHTSAERGSSYLWTRLEEKPLLSLGMHLGEGTGAALCVPLLRGAAAVFNEMATFSGAGISERIQTK